MLTWEAVWYSNVNLRKWDQNHVPMLTLEKAGYILFRRIGKYIDIYMINVIRSRRDHLFKNDSIQGIAYAYLCERIMMNKVNDYVTRGSHSKDI